MRIQLTAKYQKRKYDAKHGEANKFKLGDIVMIRMEFVSRGKKKSIAPKYSQLAKVVGISPGNVYKIRLGPKKYSWINVERLKKYSPNEDERRNMESWLISKEDLTVPKETNDSSVQLDDDTT